MAHPINATREELPPVMPLLHGSLEAVCSGKQATSTTSVMPVGCQQPAPSFPTELKLSRSQNKLQTSKFFSSKAARDSAATNDIPY